MTTAIPCELYDHREPFSGAVNMALDEALLERAMAQGVGHFRLYRWSRPTISLGYFQDYEPAILPQELRDLEVVRRLSGGGAILHDQELTYSCSLPPGHCYSNDPAQFYTVIHEILIRQLAKQGFECRFRGSDEQPASDEPFLCFSRGDRRDLVHQSCKIVGSAQRRRKGALLQHGSLLLRQSEFAPQFPGVHDLTSKTESVSEKSLCEDIISGIVELFPISELKLTFDAEITDHAETLVAERYRFTGKRFRAS